MGFHRRCCCAGADPTDGVCCAPGAQWSPSDDGDGPGLTFTVATGLVTLEGGKLLLGGWIGPNTLLDPMGGAVSFPGLVFGDDPEFDLEGIFSGRSERVDGCPPLSSVFESQTANNGLPAGADQLDPETRVSFQVLRDVANITVTQVQRFRVAGLAVIEDVLDGESVSADVVLDYFIDIQQIVAIQYDIGADLILSRTHRASIVGTLNGCQIWDDRGLGGAVDLDSPAGVKAVTIGQVVPAVDVVFDGQSLSVEIDSAIQIPEPGIGVSFNFLWSSGAATHAVTALHLIIAGPATVSASLNIGDFTACPVVELDSPCCTTPPTVSCGYHDAAAPLVDIQADADVWTFAQRLACDEPPVQTSLIKYDDQRSVQTQQGFAGCPYFVALDQRQIEIPYNWDNVDTTQCPIVTLDQDESNNVVQAVYRQSFQQQEGIINGHNGRWGWLAQYEFVRDLWGSPTEQWPTTWTIRMWDYHDGANTGGRGLSVHARGPFAPNVRWDGIHGDEGTSTPIVIAQNTPLSIIEAPAGTGHLSAFFERDVFPGSADNRLPKKYVVSAEMTTVANHGVEPPCSWIPRVMACDIYIQVFGIGAHPAAGHLIQEFSLSLLLRTPTPLTNCQ